MNLQPGDVLLTRNRLPRQNRTPGYWNHCAVYVVWKTIIEAQRDPGMVIASDPTEFLARYPLILQLRPVFSDESVCCRFCTEAAMMVGKRYGVLGVVNTNCVGVVKEAWRLATGEHTHWDRPDDLEADERFMVIDSKVTKTS